MLPSKVPLHIGCIGWAAVPPGLGYQPTQPPTFTRLTTVAFAYTCRVTVIIAPAPYLQTPSSMVSSELHSPTAACGKL